MTHLRSPLTSSPLCSGALLRPEPTMPLESAYLDAIDHRTEFCPICVQNLAFALNRGALGKKPIQESFL